MGTLPCRSWVSWNRFWLPGAILGHGKPSCTEFVQMSDREPVAFAISHGDDFALSHAPLYRQLPRVVLRERAALSLTPALPGYRHHTFRRLLPRHIRTSIAPAPSQEYRPRALARVAGLHHRMSIAPALSYQYRHPTPPNIRTSIAPARSS